MVSGTTTYVSTAGACSRMKALVASLGLGLLVIVILLGGGALFGHIADANAQGARTAIACQEVQVAIRSTGNGVALINRGEQTVSGTLRAERGGTAINTTRVGSIPPGELVEVPVPEGRTVVFTLDGCDRTFTHALH